MSDNKNYKQALYTLVTVFFFWGFIAASNGVFIPFCKTYFSLDQAISISKGKYLAFLDSDDIWLPCLSSIT